MRPKRSSFKYAVRVVVAALMVFSLAAISGTTVGVHPASSAVSTGQAIVNAAASQVGVPYCDGGGGISGPSQPTDGESTCPAPGYDCMSLAQYAVYQVTGITVPINGELLPGGQDYDGQGTLVPPQSTLAEDEEVLQPGDVVFFGGSDLWHFAHSGIYAGDGEIWDALQTGTPVGEHTLADLTGIYTNFQGGVDYSGSVGTATPTVTEGVPSPDPATFGQTVTATYNGDANYAVGTATTMITVGTATPTVIEGVPSPDPATFGQTVSYSATVSGSGAAPTGTVTFTIGATTLCTGTIASGSASCNSTAAPVGTGQTVTATYNGDSDYAVGTATTGTITVLDDPGGYVPLAPVRICDTRPGNPSSLTGAGAQCNGVGNVGEAVKPGGTLSFDVAGSFGVPVSDVTAVVLNVTEANATGTAYFTLFPTGAVRPTASDLNFTAGPAVPNLVEVGVGTAGQVSLYSAGSADAIVDLEGYVTTSSQAGAGLYDALPTPARICDTRGGNPSHLAGGATQCNTNLTSASPDNAIGPTDPLTIKVTGLGGVPSTGVEAAVVNVTVAKSHGGGYVTAYPAGATRPTASNVNFGSGQVVANRVIVPVNASTGEVTLYSSSPTDVIVDVSGYYTSAGGTGAEFTPEPSPARICDTRGSNPSGLVAPYTQCNIDTAPGSRDNPIGPAASRTIQATGLGYVPSGATAAVLNLTAVAPSASTYLTLYPEGAPPTTSDLNPPVGGVLANLVVATLTGTGTFEVFNASGNTDVLIDVAGWYTTPT